MKNFRCYEEYPYFDMRQPCSHHDCNCNHSHKHCNHPTCDELFPPMNNPPISQNNNCCNTELLYLLSGIFIGKRLH